MPNLENHSIHGRQSNNLHPLHAIYQKEVYYSGIKTFNNLPSDFKNISDDLKEFKRASKHILTF